MSIERIEKIYIETEEDLIKYRGQPTASRVFFDADGKKPWYIRVLPEDLYETDI
jgi:hypothetical protein